MTWSRFCSPQRRPPPDPARDRWSALETEPAVYTPGDLRQLAVNCVAAGASDLTLQTDQPPRCQISGRRFQIGIRPLTPSEIDGLLTFVYASESASALLAARHILDFSWEVPVTRRRRQRFRVNATGILSQRGGRGTEISLRALPSVTPTLDDVGLDAALWPLLSPPDGLVIVAGATGQGKSTTLAALVRQHMTERRVKIIDVQAPIEFNYSDLPAAARAGSSIGQSEVGMHVESFAAGVRSALRRSPDIVVIGEVRDSETARAAVDAAMTGHLVYTTLHAGDVPEIFRRLAALLAAEGGRKAAAVDILQTFRAGVAQRLAAASGLDRHPLREVAALVPALRSELANLPAETWPERLRRALAAATPSDTHLRPFAVDLAALPAADAEHSGSIA